MTNHLHPGPHPDAEVLNAFIEGALPEHERIACASHFAQCSRCREIVFLAQTPQSAQPSKMATPVGRRWFAPMPVFGTLAAAALLVVVSVFRHQTPLETKMAEVSRGSSSGEVKPAEPLPVPSHTNTQAPKERAANTVAKAKSSHREIQAPVIPADRVQATPQVHQPPAAASEPSTAQPAESARARAADKVSPLPAQAAPQLQADKPQAAQTAVTTGSIPAVNGRVEDMAKQKLTDIPGPATASNESSGIKGSVADRVGGAIAGATVTIRSRAVAASTIQTDSNGHFTVAALPAGRYELQIESPGFQKLSQQVEVKPHEVAVVASTLDVGSLAESVQVTGAVPMIGAASRRSKRLVPQSPPGQLPIAATVSSGTRILSLDSAGALFLSKNSGMTWKAIKPKWQGKATQIVLTDETPGQVADKPAFRLTTDSGSTWLSHDGLHWRLVAAP